MAPSSSSSLPGRSVRLFVKDFPSDTSESELWGLFERAAGEGSVVSLSVRGFFANVRMRDEAAAQRAIADLDGRPFRGFRFYVRRFRGFKIFVGNVSEACGSEDVRALFEEFGPVAECDIVKDYAFVHMENKEDGKAAIEHLNGMEFKGRSLCVERSNNDRKRGPTRQNSGQDAGAGRSKMPAPSYRDYPSASLPEEDYESQPTTRQAAAYRNEAEPEAYSLPAASSGRSFSPQSHSYEGRAASYGSRAASDVPAAYRAPSPAELVSAYDMQDTTATSYATPFSDSLSTYDRASAEATFTMHPSTSLPLASGYRAQPVRSGLTQSSQQAVSPLGASRSEASVRYAPYERVRLSPPRSSPEDLYREVNAISKRYTTKQAPDSFRPPYEYARFSPPRGSHENFDREEYAEEKRYVARPEPAALRRPYERVRLSPPRSNRENLRATTASKRYYSDFR